MTSTHPPACGFSLRNAALLWGWPPLKEALCQALRERGYDISDPDRLQLRKPAGAVAAASGLAAQVAINPLDEIAPVGAPELWTRDRYLRALIEEFAVNLRHELSLGHVVAAGIPAAEPEAPLEIIDPALWDGLRIDFAGDRAVGSGFLYWRVRIFASRLDAEEAGARGRVSPRAPLVAMDWRRDELVVPAPRAARLPEPPKPSPPMPMARGVADSIVDDFVRCFVEAEQAAGRLVSEESLLAAAAKECPKAARDQLRAARRRYAPRPRGRPRKSPT